MSRVTVERDYYDGDAYEIARVTRGQHTATWRVVYDLGSGTRRTVTSGLTYWEARREASRRNDERRAKLAVKYGSPR